MTKLFIVSLFAMIFGGCSTHLVSMKYQPTGQLIGNPAGDASVNVGRFVDERGEESNYLGAIRGGYYNPLKTIRTDKPVNEMVEALFADALRVRGTNEN